MGILWLELIRFSVIFNIVTIISVGQGWGVIKDAKADCVKCHEPPFSTVAYHSGGAVGASSFLLIVPERELVVAVFCNLQDVGLAELCFEVANAFAKGLEE